MKPPDHLAKLAKHDAKKNMRWDEAIGALWVDTPQAMVQAVGYLKYAFGPGGQVLFRGQNQLYGSMRPALYRGLAKEQARRDREQALVGYVEAVRTSGAFLKNTPDYAHEPLLQHYGIHTRWIDLVDNVWSALWFACHDSFVTGHRSQYLHYEPSRSETAYIVLLQVGPEKQAQPGHGCFVTDRAEVIDLRVAAPSNYLRPHAQHAFLARSTSNEMEMSSWIMGVIAIHMRRAREWLGSAQWAEVRFFFPSPYYDGGYEKLLKLAPESNHQVLGSLQHVGT